MAQRLKALSIIRLSESIKWLKERTNSLKLSFDLHINTIAYMGMHVHTNIHIMNNG